MNPPPPPAIPSLPPSREEAPSRSPGAGGPSGTDLAPRFDRATRGNWGEYLLVGVVVAVLTDGGLLLPKNYYVQVGLVYLLAINVLSLRVGRGPILTAGVFIALIWDYVFVQPYFNIYISNGQDYILFGTYFAVALIAGQLTARIRAQAIEEHLREQRATALFQFIRLLTEAKGLAEVAAVVTRQMDELLGAQTALAFAEAGRQRIELRFLESSVVSPRELPAAAWAFHHRQPSGCFTDSFSNCTGYYIPLVREDQAFGVLAVKMPPRKSLSLGQRDLLDAFARQLALIVEREHLRAASEREKLLAESEKLHRALLESVSHELRTPLAVITATTEELMEANIPSYATQVAEVHAAGLRLTRLVGNLLDQTRLESGALKPHLDWCDPRDLVNAALEGTRDALAGHPLEIAVPADMALVRADFALTEHMLVNLLLNAGLYTPPGAPVTITAGVEPGDARVFFTVADRGPGFPAALREQLFKKFVRGLAAPSGGLGLGLSIVRGFTIAQGGEVVLADNPGGGAKITLYLPHTVEENFPPE